MIRVCHAITLLELGGAQQNTLHTCTHLDPSQFDASLIAGAGGYLDAAARRALGARARFLPDLIREIRPLRDIKAYLALRRAFVELRPHIVHTHSSKAGILGRAAARRAGVPIVIHSIHGFPFNVFQPWPVRRAFIAAEKVAAAWTDRFVAVGRRNIDQGVALRIFSPSSVSLIRSGFDLAAFAPGPPGARLRASLGLPEGVPVVGTVSCLKPQKAPLDFVGMCVRVVRAIPRAHFLLVGDGALRMAVEKSVAACGAGDRFHLLGWRDDVPDILRLLDVFVMTSLWEGLPRAVLQARATGVPVVATAVDGTVEVIEDGLNGYLCRPKDVETMAERVIALLREPDRARAMGDRGREGLSEFDQSEMVRMQEELYREMANLKGVARD
ncbi:MAG: glycosyltransferase family 4 protein [Acidobacteriota bacterium]